MLAVGSKTRVPSTLGPCSDCRELGHMGSIFLQCVSALGEVTPLLLSRHVWESHRAPQMHCGPGVCSALTKPPSFGDRQIPRLPWDHVDGQRPSCTLVLEVASINIRTDEVDVSGGGKKDLE